MDSTTHGTDTTIAAALLIWSLGAIVTLSPNVPVPEPATALTGLLLGMKFLNWVKIWYIQEQWVQLHLFKFYSISCSEEVQKLIVCCYRNVRYQMPCLKRISTRFQQSALLLQLVPPFIQLCRWLLASLPGRKALQQTWCSFACVPWKYRVGHGFVNQCLFIFLVALTQQPPSSVNKRHFCTLVWGFALQA